MTHPRIKVREGEIEGLVSVTSDGKKFYSFLGIPYAQSPVGKLRFQDPLPSKKWDNILKATSEGNLSVQIDPSTNKCIGDEDCLFLNVFTPQLPSPESKPLPVMVYIHGGAFKHGSGNQCDLGPDYIVAKECILVKINYRVDILGFLCLKTTFAPGNMGLKDQCLAIKWVNDNIASFCGDPQNITLFGNSAGGCSVESHLLSPLSEGLFHKTIIQSGSVLNPWFITRDPIGNAKRLAKRFGKNMTDPKDLYELFCNIPAEELIKETPKLITDEDMNSGTLTPFSPVVCSIPGHEDFLEQYPLELLKSGNFHKVPTISGFCNKEGILLRVIYSGEPLKFLNDRNLIECVPLKFKIDKNDFKDKFKAVYRQRNNDLNDNDYALNFLTDVVFLSGLSLSLELKRKHHKDEYFYCFTYDGNINYLKTTLHLSSKGACHADELAYLGNITNVNMSNASPKDFVVKNRMVQMWTDFAKTGNPTPEQVDDVQIKWPQVSQEQVKMLEIGEELILVNNDAFSERIKLWEELYQYYE